MYHQDVFEFGWAYSHIDIHELQDGLVRDMDQCVLCDEEIRWWKWVPHIIMFIPCALQSKLGCTMFLDELVILHFVLRCDIPTHIVCILRPIDRLLPPAWPVPR